MKGIIFNAVEEAVVDLHGADAWDDIVEAAGVDGAYTALGTYPDRDLFAIVGAACAHTGSSPNDLLRLLGRHVMPILIRSVEDLVDRDADVFDFLSSVHGIIHVEVRKVSPDARPPDVIPLRLDDDTLQVTYRSERGLDALAEGLFLGAGDQFGQPLTVERREEPTEDGSTVFVLRRQGS